MTIDVDALVAPLSEDQPSGPDLSYESERQQIESAFESSVSGDDGDGEGTDWRAVIGLITGEAAKTRDLWLPIYLMRAAAKSANIELVADSAELLARLVEERWDDVHPQLDDYGFIGRKSPCESLTRLRDFLTPLSHVPLIEHQRLGRYNGADFIRFREAGSQAENFGMFKALIEATGFDPLHEAVARLEAIKSSLRRVDAVMTANADGDTATNFQPTYDLLDNMRKAVCAQLPEDSVEEEVSVADDTIDAGGATTSAASGGPGFSGGINSRADVVKALDAITAYYARSEPNSPVPFALRRARDWISLDFLAVLEDIAPGGVGEAKRVLTGGRNVSGGSSDSGFAPAPVSSESPPASSGGRDDGW